MLLARLGNGVQRPGCAWQGIGTCRAPEKDRNALKGSKQGPKKGLKKG